MKKRTVIINYIGWFLVSLPICCLFFYVYLGEEDQTGLLSTILGIIFAALASFFITSLWRFIFDFKKGIKKPMTLEDGQEASEISVLIYHPWIIFHPLFFLTFIKASAFIAVMLAIILFNEGPRVALGIILTGTGIYGLSGYLLHYTRKKWRRNRSQSSG